MVESDKHLTPEANQVIELAEEEAQRFNHNYIGTEHLLLGLIRNGDTLATKVLTDLGVQLNNVRSAVEFIIGRGDRAVLGEIGLTPRGKKVIELAIDEARRRSKELVEPIDLLFGLVREGEGIAAGVLESLGVSLDRLRLEQELKSRLEAAVPPSRVGLDRFLEINSPEDEINCDHELEELLIENYEYNGSIIGTIVVPQAKLEKCKKCETKFYARKESLKWEFTKAIELVSRPEKSLSGVEFHFFRDELSMNPSEFAEALGVYKEEVQAWEKVGPPVLVGNLAKMLFLVAVGKRVLEDYLGGVEDITIVGERLSLLSKPFNGVEHRLY